MNPVCVIVPNNFAHRAGDGSKNRKRILNDICPALHIGAGPTQDSYVLLTDCNYEYVNRILHIW
jgi:hypothetical protein